MRHVDGVSPDWPLGFDVFEPYYGEAEALYHVHGQRGENPTEPWSSTNTETRMSDRTGPKPRIPYWHLWTDADGVSHQQRCSLTEFELKGVGDAAPQWNNRHPRIDSTVVVTVQPVGWVGNWHENPAPQWIVVLSGRWWIESMDGVRVEQGPGEFSLGEDQGCTTRDGRKGHRSGTIGDGPAVLMTVQLHRPPLRIPCHTR